MTSNKKEDSCLDRLVKFQKEFNSDCGSQLNNELNSEKKQKMISTLARMNAKYDRMIKHEILHQEYILLNEQMNVVYQQMQVIHNEIDEIGNKTTRIVPKIRTQNIRHKLKH